MLDIDYKVESCALKVCSVDEIFKPYNSCFKQQIRFCLHDIFQVAGGLNDFAQKWPSLIAADQGKQISGDKFSTRGTTGQYG